MSRRAQFPAIVEVGSGSLQNLKKFLDHLGISKPLIIYDAQLPALVISRVTKLCYEDKNELVVPAPPGEPTTDVADSVSTLARKSGCNGVIAVGGGSVMDLGKAVSMLVQHSQDAATSQGIDLVSGRGLPVVCIPTTAGSGAEATRSAVLTNTGAQIKRGINALGVVPDAVILDPDLLLSLPPAPRIAALLDATAHALESFIGKNTWQVSETFAKAAFPHLGGHLNVDAAQLTVLEAESALLGSFFAGAAICSSETGAVHALAYPLTEYFQIPHAYAVGTLLPDVMLLQKDECSERLTFAIEMMGFVSLVDFVHRTQTLRARLNVTPSLKEIVTNPDSLAKIADRAMTLAGALKNSPKEWNREDILNAYERAADAKVIE